MTQVSSSLVSLQNGLFGYKSPNNAFDLLGHPNIPSYDSRIALVRLLLECQLRGDALDLLEALQKEDDQSVDLWYLYGWTYYMQGEEDSTAEEKADSWNEARDCLERGLKVKAGAEYLYSLCHVNY